MRKVRYSVAMSLDGFIAGPGGEYDWLPTDLDFDWSEFMGRFDTVVMGRGTWDVVAAQGGASGGMRTYVISRTLDPAAHGDVIEVALVPILLGEGIPFLPGLSGRVGLELFETRELGSGVVQMVYSGRG